MLLPASQADFGRRLQPNLIPPIRTPDQAASYLAQLQKLSPETQFLPSLYLNNDLTPELIREAKAKGVIGVKSYPRGVTTNSDGGVGMEGYAVFDAVFGEMEKQDMVLNLHGEVPSDIDGDVSARDPLVSLMPAAWARRRRLPRVTTACGGCDGLER